MKEQLTLFAGDSPASHSAQQACGGGVNDDRYLWPAMLALVEKYKPTWVIGENVAGLKSMGVKSGPAKVESRSSHRDAHTDVFEAVYSQQETMLLNSICEDLEGIGYEVIPFIIPACGLGAPHRRDRVWILAHAKRAERGQGCATGHEPNGRPCQRQEEAGGLGASGENGDQRNVADPHWRQYKREKQALCAGGNAADHGREVLANTQRERWPEMEQPEPCRAQSEGAAGQAGDRCDARGRRWWQVEPSVGRVADGIPNRVDRLGGLGNAVTPFIPRIIGEHILQVQP